MSFRVFYISGPGVAVLQEGGPLPGPKSGLLSNTQKWNVQGDTCTDKGRDFVGKDCPRGDQEDKWIQQDCSAMWLAVSGFYGDGISFWLSLVNHSDSGSFVVTQALLNQDGFQWGGFWEVGRTCGISFLPFPNSSGWWWLVSFMFLTRTFCCKITNADGYYGIWPEWIISVFPVTAVSRSGKAAFWKQGG